jgi:hypothetical protein
MPQKPYKEYEPGFDPLADAKEFLSRTSEPWQTPVSTTPKAPTRTAAGNRTLSSLITGEDDEPVDDGSWKPLSKEAGGGGFVADVKNAITGKGGFWEKVKHYGDVSPLPDNWGGDLVDEMQAKGDQHALHGEPRTFRDDARAFLEPTAKFTGNLVRSMATPLGAATANPLGKGSSFLTRLASGVGSAIYGAEGAETALDSDRSPVERAVGGVGGLFGLLGVHGATKSGTAGAATSRTGTALNEGRFSKAATAADDLNAGPAAIDGPTPPVAPTRHPVDLFDTPEFRRDTSALTELGPKAQSASAPVPGPAAPGPSPTATFLAHQDDFNGGSIPLYNVEGGPMHGSTVSAETLAENGIGLPHTPAFDPHIPDAGALKPHIKANEFAEMLKGREKFTEKNPGIALPPGGRDALDQAGLEYGRTQRELKRLLGMPDADPAEVGRMKQGAREMGSRLRSASKPPPPEFTNVEPPSTANEMSEVGSGRVDRNLTPEQYAAERSGHFVLPEDAAPVSDIRLDEMASGTGAKLEGKFGTVNRPEIAEGWVDPHPLGRRKADRSLPGSRSSEAQRLAAPENQSAITAEMDALDSQAAPATDTHGIMNERGEVPVGALLNFIGRPVAGAAAGAAFSPEDHRMEGAVAGGALGAASLIPGAGKKFEQVASAAMLSGPQTLAKIALGNTGGGLIRAGQKAIVEGNPAIMGRTLKEMLNVPRLGREAIDNFRNHAQPERLGGGYATEGPLSIPGRLIGATDQAYQDALKRSGFNAGEAADVALTSEPKNSTLLDILNLQRKHAAVRVPAPFMKTLVGMVDQGLVDPAKAIGAAFEGKGNLAGAVTAGTAGAAGVGGYLAGDNLPGWAEPFGIAAAGPYAAPAAIGNALSHVPKGKSPIDYLVAAARAVGNQMPTAEANDIDPRALLARLVPAPVRDVATYLDGGTERETPGLFGKSFAKIPGLRSTLPAKKRSHARGNTRPRANE